MLFVVGHVCGCRRIMKLVQRGKYNLCDPTDRRESWYLGPVLFWRQSDNFLFSWCLFVRKSGSPPLWLRVMAVASYQPLLLVMQARQPSIDILAAR